MRSLPRPLDNPALRPYLNDVISWHGYIRFLGLPTFQDRTDVAIEELFVAPAFSSHRISPDTDPNLWPATESILSLLEREKRLVALGDPGSGKSTVVNWLAWRLAAGLSRRPPEWLDQLLPLPLVLRELNLSAIDGFDSLLDAFAQRPVATALGDNMGELRAYLEAGHVLLLLDGLDEIPTDLRDAVRMAIWEGWDRYPLIYSLATSRLVGYEDSPLHARASPVHVRAFQKRTAQKPGKPSRLLRVEEHIRLHGDHKAALVYVAPFNDSQIRAFINNWYSARLVSKRDAEGQASLFISALRGTASTQRLARTPNLLTIMALVFKVRVHLPDGRGLLYEHIAQAYLESIDQARGLHHDPYPWQEKRRWLARVGFEMQHRRWLSANTNDESALLAQESNVLEWIQMAMAHSGYPSDENFARDYLKSIARRSGLLLPRGEKRYAFLHLSFQEYFAGVYLLEQVRDPDWGREPKKRAPRTRTTLDPRVTKAALRDWAEAAVWRETLIFSFELLAHDPRWADQLAEWIFGAGCSRVVPEPKRAQTGVLLTRLLVNPHSGLPTQTREVAWKRCWNLLVADGRVLTMGEEPRDDLPGEPFNSVLPTLCSSDLWRERFLREVAARKTIFLNLTGCSITDVAPWVAAAPALTVLSAFDCAFANLKPFADCHKLVALLFDASSIEDWSPLEDISSLTHLYLLFPRFQDLCPLAKLERLIGLQVRYAPLKNLRGIEALPRLTELGMGDTPLEDLSAITALEQLVELTLSDIDTALDLSVLLQLPKLRNLRIRRCPRVLNLPLLMDRMQVEVDLA